MGESKHTREPWIPVRIYDEGSAWKIVERTKSGKAIAGIQFQISRPDEEKTANAYRITDCVNSCKDIPNPEAIPEIVDALCNLLGNLDLGIQTGTIETIVRGDSFKACIAAGHRALEKARQERRD